MTTRAALAEAAFATFTDAVTLRTQARRQFIDVTELVAERVRRSGIRDGLVSVQSHHTTTAVVVNENEPLLLGDFDRMLDRLCPRDVDYGHDDLARRGDVPARRASQRRPRTAGACCWGSAQTIHVAGGTLQTGRWQRLLLLELDGPRTRTLSIVILGSRA